jgi:hypothetical protein
MCSLKVVHGKRGGRSDAAALARPLWSRLWVVVELLLCAVHLPPFIGGSVRMSSSQPPPLSR